MGCSASGTLLCAACTSKLPPSPASDHDFITSAYAYRDPRIRQLVRLLKYKNARHAAEIFALPLAGILTELLGEEGSFLGERILLVPVPLSRGRRRSRGYNQAELLARSMLLRMPAGAVSLDSGILKKIKETEAQADIQKKSVRLANLGDCFFAERARGGETVILIDDVTTTGATLLAARKALRAAGYKKVLALTAAH